MGKLFELISDKALEKESKKFDYSICDVCGEECETYRYKGTQYDENGNAFDDSYDSYAVCADWTVSQGSQEWFAPETPGDTIRVFVREKDASGRSFIHQWSVRGFSA